MRALLTVTLTSQVIPDPPPVGARLWRRLRSLVAQGQDADALIRWAGMHAEAEEARGIAQRLARVGEAERALREYGEAGVFVVTEFDLDFPRRWLERLGGKHPPLLFAVGNRELLRADSVGVVGSRDVDAAGALFARDVAAECVAQGRVVVSGGARGVDATAMRAAIDHGGATVGLLADSLLAMASRPAMRGFLEAGQACLARTSSPQGRFTVASAMGRNRLIYAHAEATVVVAARDGSGGSWTGAREAIRHRLCPVLVRAGPGVPDGNLRLAREGGIAIASPQEIWQHRDATGPSYEQGTLF